MVCSIQLIIIRALRKATALTIKNKIKESVVNIKSNEMILTLLNIELELKVKRDNAEIRLDNVAMKLFFFLNGIFSLLKVFIYT
ncbi:unnamed protein product [Rotaria sp. Silwood1]|nr:unnamed protein product [Rotaria sp. Silwood1]CAF1256901.1 unnamed protein product [Rotaria sp. Silwood1]CAF1607416.1 unnamed protein product [Rotaria sp. Silwood1]CAF3745177.1 unnamed protein product [Rotaria sp. Silwood1]CAF3803689.1 unnamed protein product [Rotaria sp. Silwood1]